MPYETLIADFIVTNPAERDMMLRSALSTAKANAAVQGKRGILVTRHDLQRFSVSLTPNVPYGYIHELDQA